MSDERPAGIFTAEMLEEMFAEILRPKRMAVRYIVNPHTYRLVMATPDLTDEEKQALLLSVAYEDWYEVRDE